MRREAATHRRQLILSLLALLFWLPSIVLAQTYPVPRTQFPFDVSRGDSSLDEKIKIEENRVYHFNLQFEFGDAADQARVSELVGDGSRYPDGRFGRPGIAVPIYLKIAPIVGDLNAQPIFERTIDTEARYAMRADNFQRTIANVRLPPGIYRVQAHTIQEISKFSGTRTQLAIGYDPRASPIR